MSNGDSKDPNQPPSSENQNKQSEPSIFERRQYKNPEVRARQIRLAKIVSGVIGAFFILGAIAWVSPIGVRIVAQITTQIRGDLTQPTPTATIDLSSLDVASPTPPPTATTLYGGDTFSQDLPTVTPTPTPKNLATSIAIRATQDAIFKERAATQEAGGGQSGAIFVTVEATPLPTSLPTPLPTRGAVDFTSSAGSDLPTLEYARDPRCINEATEADYVLCVVRLTTAPIEP